MTMVSSKASKHHLEYKARRKGSQCLLNQAPQTQESLIPKRPWPFFHKTPLKTNISIARVKNFEN